MSREQHLKAVSDVAVQDARLGGMCETERNHSARVDRSGDAVVVVRFDVRVADSCQLDALSRDVDGRTPMCEVEPARVSQRGSQLTPWQPRAVPALTRVG